MMTLLFSLLSSLVVNASPIPCLFWTRDITNNSIPKYDIAKAYKASDLVIIGKADKFILGKSQDIKVLKTLKGDVQKEIVLEGAKVQGTESFGTAIQINKEFLMLLSKSSKYKWVDSGSGCPNSFEVIKNKVKIGTSDINISDLKSYFEKSPSPFTIE